jgi:hypothetical protein
MEVNTDLSLIATGSCSGVIAVNIMIIFKIALLLSFRFGILRQISLKGFV